MNGGAPWRYETTGTLAIVQFDDSAVLVWREGNRAQFYPVGTRPGPAEIIGMRARRGPDWVWGNQGGVDMQGTVLGISCVEGGWVCVLWDNGEEHFYRWGFEGCFDLVLEAPSQVTPPTRWQSFCRTLRILWNEVRHG